MHIRYDHCNAATIPFLERSDFLSGSPAAGW
jgi:hypothetical protein